MAQIRVEPIPAQEAAQFLQGLEKLDPRGNARALDVAEMCKRGACYRAHGLGADCVYVLVVNGGQTWIDAAKGAGPVDLTASLLPHIEASATGNSVAFQTARRGLVRKAQRLGYQVTGWILKKDLNHATT